MSGTDSPRPAARGFLARLGGALGLLVLLSFLGAPSAGAHAELLDTDPTEGQVLDAPPEELTLTFNEPVGVNEGSARLIDADGTEQVLAARSVDSRLVATTPSDLGPGSYLLAWEVVSADGHPISGGLAFVVEDVDAASPSDDGGDAGASTAPPVPEQSSEPARPELAPLSSDVPRAVAQAVQYLGSLSAIGAAVVLVFLLPAGHTPGLGRRLSSAVTVSAAAGLIGSLALIPTSGLARTRIGEGTFTDPEVWADGTQFGQGAASALAAGGLLVLALRSSVRSRSGRAARPGRAPLLLVLGGIAAVVAAPILVGHTRSVDPAWLVVASDAVHLLAAGIWLGGLLALVVVLTVGDSPASERALVVSRFSGIAAGVVALLGLTGVLLGWRILGSWAALVQTAYGLTLLVKLGLVAVAVAIAAYNRFRLLPRVRAGGTSRTLRRVVAVEGLVLVLAVEATGSLVGQDPTLPDAEAQAPGASTAQPLEQEERVLDLGQDGAQGQARLVLGPADGGSRSLAIDLTDPSGAPLEPGEEPRLSLTHAGADVGPITVPLEADSGSPGSYTADLDLPLSGTWELELRVRTSTFDEPSVRTEVVLP